LINFKTGFRKMKNIFYFSKIPPLWPTVPGRERYFSRFSLFAIDEIDQKVP
jgi:hypothetical protein